MKEFFMCLGLLCLVGISSEIRNIRKEIKTNNDLLKEQNLILRLKADTLTLKQKQ